MHGLITDPTAALNFILGGNAIVTLKSLKSGNHYTYKISLAPKQEGRDTTYFVSLLTGPDNTADYSYIGIITSNQFRWTKKAKVEVESPSVRAMLWVTINLFMGKFPPMTEIWHEGRCGRCGRELTVPESIATGIGPVCAAQAAGA